MSSPFQPQPNVTDTVMDKTKEGINTITDTASNVAETAKTTVEGIRNSVSDTIGDFSSKVAVDANASKEFLTSNTIVSRIGFVLLVLIIFLFALRICMSILGYFLSPSTTPYIIYGMLNGSQSQVISQNPNSSNSVTILRSNNQPSGVECTWSVWLYVDPGSSPAMDSSFQNVFVKGDGYFDSNTGLSSVDNGPGMYIYESSTETKKKGSGQLSGVYNLIAFFNIIGGTDVPYNQFSVPSSFVDVSGIPLQKWFHVALRLQNTVLDVYINGTLSKRTVLPDVPKQNYADVYVCGNGGFPGALSNLRYYPYALNAFEIGAISWYGPNMTASSLANTLKSNNGYTYLSNIWYNRNL
jgi:hypothetical protein